MNLSMYACIYLFYYANAFFIHGSIVHLLRSLKYLFFLSAFFNVQYMSGPSIVVSSGLFAVKEFGPSD